MDWTASVFIAFTITALICLVNTQSNYTVRLAGTGSSYNEGRVEIYVNGEWGTVCDDSFNWEEAHVVCRQLGFDRARTYYYRAYYGQGTGRIWLRVYGCTGYEATLKECPYTIWDEPSGCSHIEDVGVICYLTSTQAQYSIRLAGTGSSDSEGRVEINYQGQWGTVCSDLWQDVDARVVCNQLGFTGPAAARINAYYGEAYGPIWLDNVGCTSDDETLAECSHNSWGSHNCDHSDDAGVVCSASNNTEQYSIRLAGVGSTFSEGRVEIFYNGKWGTVCDDSFYNFEINVVCRQLGFRSGRNYRHNAYYGYGSGEIWLDNLNCIGSEVTLASCTHSGWGVHNCDHGDDVGVVCYIDQSPTPAHYSVRLAGIGSSTSEGRVEINYLGRWGTVCGDLWDSTDAQVVCRQLGFTGGAVTRLNAYYGQGSGPIWMDDVRCSSSSMTLGACSHSGWGTHNCDHSQDAGVACYTSDTIVENTVRLNGVGSSNQEGRVEIFHDGRWGTVCHDFFYTDEANVVCRQLGFERATRYRTSAYYGQGSGTIWMDDLSCQGTELNVASCIHPGWGVTDCDHREDVGVVCYIPPGLPDQFSLRLSGNTNSTNEGRVEINYNGQWGTICSLGWELADANVACRQLGFSGAVLARTGGFYGEGTGAIWLRYLRCGGSELFLSSCYHSGWGNTGSCSHGDDAGVVCSTESDVDEYTTRLAGAGSVNNAGRVEIHYNGRWGTVCDSSWDLDDADIVCRRLGFIGATEALSGAFYGRGSGPVWISDVVCSGTETSLEECIHSGFGNTDCDHSRDAAVVCNTTRQNSDFEVRLVGGSSISEGRVEISYAGQWGTVCADRWGITDATIVCKQLGFVGANDAPDDAYFGEGTGTIWLDNVACIGTELGLNECSHNGWGVHDCDHSEDAGVVCTTYTNEVSPVSTGGLAGLCVVIFVLLVVIIVLGFVVLKLRRNLRPKNEETGLARLTISGTVDQSGKAKTSASNGGPEEAYETLHVYTNSALGPK